MSKAKAVALATLIAGVAGALIHFFPDYAVAIGALAALIPSPLTVLLTRDSEASDPE